MLLGIYSKHTYIVELKDNTYKSVKDAFDLVNYSDYVLLDLSDDDLLELDKKYELYRYDSLGGLDSSVIVGSVFVYSDKYVCID